MSPRRIVATLLEADDMLPPQGAPDPAGIDDIKGYIANVNNAPLPVKGVPAQGYYKELENRFRGSRLKTDGPTRYFKIENNTYLVLDTLSHTIAVKLHHTDIITCTPEDTITVDNGGWQTVTTLARLNDYLPSGWRIYTQKGEWYWHNWKAERPDEVTQSREAAEGFRFVQPYSNGDTITADGTLHPRAASQPIKIRKRRAV